MTMVTRALVVTRDKPATWREWEITTEREEKQ